MRVWSGLNAICLLVVLLLCIDLNILARHHHHRHSYKAKHGERRLEDGENRARQLLRVMEPTLHAMYNGVFKEQVNLHGLRYFRTYFHSFKMGKVEPNVNYFIKARILLAESEFFNGPKAIKQYIHFKLSDTGYGLPILVTFRMHKKEEDPLSLIELS